MNHTEHIDKGQVPWFPQTASIDDETPLFSFVGSQKVAFFQFSVGDAFVLALSFETASDDFFQTQVLTQAVNQSDGKARNLYSYRSRPPYQDFLAVRYEWPVAIRTVATTN